MIPYEAKQALLAWYREHQRDLPWRRTRDPYRIMVSEIMLQQTQVDRVIPYYHAFLERFPTLQALADAPASEVIRLWAGLGYNRRALNLQRAARAVVEAHGGEFPRTRVELRTLPGIGPYTAGAIASFAFEQDVGFADTNIRRVLHRVVAGPEVPEPTLKAREIEALAGASVPPGQGYDWNQALIEVGALICRARSTDCESCPLASWCVARPTIGDALAAHRTGRSGKSQPFETTSRYFRGRVVDLLRSAPDGISARDLAASIKPEQPSATWIAPYLTGLVRDGLIVEASSAVREDPPAYDGQVDDGDRTYRLPD